MSKYIKEHNFSDYKYVIYARKSTESDDRQYASIPSQLKVLGELTDELEIKVNPENIITESASGYKLGRPNFAKMIEKIRSGEADSIICWKLSRLSRNPEDAGIIMGMLQRGEIKHIRTFDKNWYPEDNVMMMYVEFGINNQFSKDLSDDTKRGLNTKAENGWSPKAILPLGYMHNPFKKKDVVEIMPDPDRFEIVQKALKKVANGEMTPKQALSYANDLGLRTRATKKSPSKEVSDSVFYRMLSNPFYYGRYEYPTRSGNWLMGKHEKAITEEEFNLIQRYTGRKDAPRPQKHLFPYTGLMKCGECGCSIVVDPKQKAQKNGNVHTYHYYRCTKSKGNCSQKYLERDELEKQLVDIIGSIQISEEFHNWALNELRKDTEKDITDRDEMIKIAQEGYNNAVTEINNLTRKYVKTDSNIDEETYKTLIKELKDDKAKYKEMLNNTDKRVDEFVNRTEKHIDFAKTAQERFNTNDIQIKNSILNQLAANIVIRDLTVSIEVEEPIMIIKKGEEKYYQIKRDLEPLKRLSQQEKGKILITRNDIWGQLLDSFLNLRVDFKVNINVIKVLLSSKHNLTF